MKKAFELKKIFMRMIDKNAIEPQDKVGFNEVFQKLWSLHISPHLIPKA